MKEEESLQIAVCNYIRLQYPHVLFNSDLSGIRLTMGQAIKVKKLRSTKGFPDLIIYEPRGSWHGLFIELKKDGEVLLNKKRELKNDHLKEQAEVMERLYNLGYYASFAIGFNEAKKIIDNYLTK